MKENIKMKIKLVCDLRQKKPLNQHFPKSQEVPMQESVVKNTNIRLHKVETKHLQKNAVPFIASVVGKKASRNKLIHNNHLVDQAVSPFFSVFIVLMPYQLDRYPATKLGDILNGKKIKSSKPKPETKNVKMSVNVSF